MGSVTTLLSGKTPAFATPYAFLEQVSYIIDKFGTKVVRQKERMSANKTSARGLLLCFQKRDELLPRGTARYSWSIGSHTLKEKSTYPTVTAQGLREATPLSTVS